MGIEKPNQENYSWEEIAAMWRKCAGQLGDKVKNLEARVRELEAGVRKFQDFADENHDRLIIKLQKLLTKQ